jgi:hypothetical protein
VLLAIGRIGEIFIYTASPNGYEIKEDAVVQHVSTDADFTYIVAVEIVDGSSYRIHGFGSAVSFSRF